MLPNAGLGGSDHLMGVKGEGNYLGRNVMGKRQKFYWGRENWGKRRGRGQRGRCIERDG